jgi:hypothetical protein
MRQLGRNAQPGIHARAALPAPPAGAVTPFAPLPEVREFPTPPPASPSPPPAKLRVVKGRGGP